MAQRRMFSKTITNSSRFLMMPQSSQNLYFHLGMNADDDGFCEHFSIMRMTESKPDDLKVLQAKGLVKVFDENVLIVKEWKENNYIQKDRYTPSKYLEIYKEELALLSHNNELDTECIQSVSKVDTQVRLGKVSIGKNKTDFSPEKSAPLKSIQGGVIDLKNQTYLQESDEGGGEEDIVVDYTVDEDGNPRRDGFGRARGHKDDIPRKARDLAQYYNRILIQHHHIPSEVIIRGEAVISRIKKILKDNPKLTSQKLSEYILNFVKTADTAQDAANYIFMLSPMSITKWQIDNA